MAIARMPDAFFDLAAHHLPPEPAVGPAGGRPPIDHQCILKVLWFVLATGCRWEDVPPELGCSGRTAHRFLQRWEEMGVGTGSTPTCCVCCVRRTSSTPTWSSSMRSWCGPSAVAS